MTSGQSTLKILILGPLREAGDRNQWMVGLLKVVLWVLFGRTIHHMATIYSWHEYGLAYVCIGHGIFPFIFADSIPYPHIAGLSSVKDEHCMVSGGGRVARRSESHHSSKILNKLWVLKWFWCSHLPYNNLMSVWPLQFGVCTILTLHYAISNTSRIVKNSQNSLILSCLYWSLEDAPK